MVETRQISFPSKDISRLIHTVQPVHRHFVLLVMSNLIRVQDEMFGNKETVFREIIAQVLQDEPERDPEFGMADTRYIRELIWPYASYIYTQVNKMSRNYQ